VSKKVSNSAIMKNFQPRFLQSEKRKNKKLLKKAAFLLSLVFLSVFYFQQKSNFQDGIYNSSLSNLFAEIVKAMDQVDELQQQIDKLEELKQLSENATTPLEEELDNLESQINSARAGINSAKAQAVQLAAEIEQREEDLAYHYLIFSNRVAESYKRARTFNPLSIFFSSQSASQLTKNLAYQDSAKAQDDLLIRSISDELLQLSEDKKKLEDDQVRLASLEQQLNSQAAFFQGEIDKAKAYQQELSGQIADLSAKQQAILAARSGSYTTSAGSVPIGSDYEGSIAGFREKAPSNTFAVFSFGAYTHRKGMSQYGAKARAENGQDYKTILREYYGKEPVSKDTGGNIDVDGVGSISFEDQYLYGIAEMPSDWHIEALKAQAVAARTYAYRYKVEGRSICITESCQVYNASKAANPPDLWKRAVQETRGMVLEDVVTYYSSTSGGYLSTSGWDTTDGGGSGDWTSRAWESIAGSPWFYKAWYRNGYRNSDSSCGRYPWMTQEEMSDILNAYLVRKEPNGADTSRILPVTINDCPIGGQSGNPYSMSELRSFVSNPVTNISSVSVSHSDAGSTSSVVFQTNRGTISLSGSEFKEIFNTRAPGYISIPQSGFAFFNIEKK
jgi:peptidoglycan hydrolase-like amidase